MKLSLAKLSYRTPGIRLASKAIPPAWFFRWASWTTGLAARSGLTRQSRLKYFRTVLASSHDPARLEELGRKHLLYRKWSHTLVSAWPGWAERHHELVRVEGEEHLKAALRQGRGAFLLSGHFYGFERVVAPALAERDYRMNRTGFGWRGDDISERWGKGRYARWEHINLGDDRHQRLQALAKVERALGRNEVVHLSIRGFSQGEPQFEIPFFYGKFFLDGRLMEALEYLDAPVLPCFALSDERGRFIVRLYPPEPPRRAEIMSGFGQRYAGYLRDHPEFAQIWKNVAQRRNEW
jgi:lauroyl/myristoyl acyltransferase